MGSMRVRSAIDASHRERVLPRREGGAHPIAPGDP